MDGDERDLAICLAILGTIVYISRPVADNPTSLFLLSMPFLRFTQDAFPSACQRGSERKQVERYPSYILPRAADGHPGALTTGCESDRLYRQCTVSLQCLALTVVSC
jgi:hypothetical protein